MRSNQFANLASFNAGERPKERRTLKTSLTAIIKEFGIKNGSFKVYVRDGKASDRIEIQQQFKHEIN
ncbi:MAG: hypothetical protein ACRBBP_10875 [Bdellovibrionales bacterium]